MEQLLQALLEAANKFKSMRGVYTGWCKIGSFIYKGRTHSFIIEGTRGTFRQVDTDVMENEWFDVIKKGDKFVSIIHNGIKYNLQPTLF